MKNETLFKLSYGMYAIGVKDEEKASACIVNTVFQVTNSPNTLAVSMNHQNYSHDCIQKTGLSLIHIYRGGFQQLSEGNGSRGIRRSGLRL